MEYEWCGQVTSRSFLKWSLGGHHTLLARVAGFLITTIIVGCRGAAAWAPPQPHHATHAALLNALGGGLGWLYPASTGDRFRVAQDEGYPNRLLTRGVSSGNVE
jgi:hypothetical protein